MYAMEGVNVPVRKLTTEIKHRDEVCEIRDQRGADQASEGWDLESQPWD